MRATPMTPERPRSMSRCGSTLSVGQSPPVRRRLSLADRRGSAQSLTLGMAKLGLWAEGGEDGGLDSTVEDTRDDTASEQQRELLFETATVVMKRLSGRLSFGETADSDGYDDSCESASSGYVSDRSSPGTPPPPARRASKPSPLAKQRLFAASEVPDTPPIATQGWESMGSICHIDSMDAPMSPTAEAMPAAMLDYLDLDGLAEIVGARENEDEAVPNWSKDEFEQFLATLEYEPTPWQKPNPALSRTARSALTSRSAPSIGFRNRIDRIDERCAPSPKRPAPESDDECQEDAFWLNDQHPTIGSPKTSRATVADRHKKHIKLGHALNSDETN